MRRLNTSTGPRPQPVDPSSTSFGGGDAQTFYRPSTAPRGYTHPAFVNASRGSPTAEALPRWPLARDEDLRRHGVEEEDEEEDDEDREAMMAYRPDTYRSDSYRPDESRSPPPPRPRRPSKASPVSTTSPTYSIMPPSRMSPSQMPLRPYRRTSSNTSHTSFPPPPATPNMYPPPTKPLPAVPNSARSSSQKTSSGSFDMAQSVDASYSLTSTKLSSPDLDSMASFSPVPERRERTISQQDVSSTNSTFGEGASISQSEISSQSDLAVVRYRMLVPEDNPSSKKKDSKKDSKKESKKESKKDGVHYLDFSASSGVLSTKHGNNLIIFWSLSDGRSRGSVKITSYTDAHSRSRDYMIRSHAILSESSQLAVVAVKFGMTLEVWNWAQRKCLQSIGDADRWNAGRWESSENAWSQLAVYRADDHTIDLWSTPGVRKKPLAKVRIINLRKADLPFVPQYPEITISSTRPLLITASGPRPPRRSHPPPNRETLLVAWDIHENSQASHAPYKVVRPYHNEGLETAIPCDLVTNGDVAVSIWIPASFRSIPVQTAKHGLDYQLVATAVPNKIVMIWDLKDNSTRIFNIPNVIACVSPDCQLVAYCDANSTNTGARGSLVIYDAMTGTEVWSWPDPDAIARDSGPRRGFEQFNDLGRVTSLAFSPNSRYLVVGDVDGHTGVYERRDVSGEGPTFNAI